MVDMQTEEVAEHRRVAEKVAKWSAVDVRPNRWAAIQAMAAHYLALTSAATQALDLESGEAADLAEGAAKWDAATVKAALDAMSPAQKTALQAFADDASVYIAPATWGALMRRGLVEDDGVSGPRMSKLGESVVKALT